jgi:hypothetical protein
MEIRLVEPTNEDAIFQTVARTCILSHGLAQQELLWPPPLL